MSTIAIPGLRSDPELSLVHLFEQEVLADPYPLYHRLQVEAPIYWDPFLHAWVVTRYSDVSRVLHEFSAQCAPAPEMMGKMGVSELTPIAEAMMQMLLFMDAPLHTRLRAVASQVFAPRNVESLAAHIRDVVSRLFDEVKPIGRMDVLADLGDRLPAIITAEMLGVPPSDHQQLKSWSADFAEVLGNWQHNPDRVAKMVQTLNEMTDYFRSALRAHRKQPNATVISALLGCEVDGQRLSEESIIANCVLVMVGGQETTPNLIGNGTLSLLRNPSEWWKLRRDRGLIPSAVEELLRFESPSQHTTRLAPSDTEIQGVPVRKGQAVIAVMGAANRDPERFPHPDRLDVQRRDNRHLAFGAGPHFCFGAALARIEGQVVFDALVKTFSEIELEPGPLTWRDNVGLRGLTALPVRFTVN
jgi:cytochrome P450